MKIERIDLYHIRQTLVNPFRTSFGVETERDCILIAMRSEGLTGWGECVASHAPGYSYETAGTAWHILSEFLVPSMLGQNLTEPCDIGDWTRAVRGHPMAKAGLDQAAWDLTAQRDGVSVAQKLAEPYPDGPRQRVKVGVSIGIQPDKNALIKRIQQHVDEGYRRIKLKIKPSMDLLPARQAREAFPDLPIMLDANSAYQLRDAPIFQAMDELDLLMIEQPLAYDDMYEHSQLKPQIKTPLCLDESIHSLADAKFGLAIGAYDIINIKPGRVGGWTEARKIHDLCYEAGIPVWCGGMLETGVGRAGQLALASLPGFTLPGDISATERYYVRDVATPFVLNREDSTITVPAGSGLGITVDPHLLQVATLRKETFTL